MASSPLSLEAYDVIVAGGGTAGCVLAARLTEDPNLTVLLLEAGEDANDDFRVLTPGLFPLLLDSPDRDWGFRAEASPGLNGRKMPLPRGKCLGGSSAINLMALIYPSKAGLDAWSELGNPGWDWEGLAPYYRKSQRHCPPSDEVADALGLDFIDPKVQGTKGPICSSYPSGLDPLQKAWVDTWKGLQKSITGDPLTGVHTGGYTSPSSVDPQKGQRSFAGNEYYAPAANRPNLHVVTGAMIDKVELDARDPENVVATGITFSHADKVYTAKATKEVVLSAGTIGSSTILERSGIGSKKLCRKLGIHNIIDNPNVGENLQDHLMCDSSFEVKDGLATADMMRDLAVVKQVMELYETSKTGPLANGAGYSFAYTPLTDFLTSSESQADIKALLDKYLQPDSSPRYPAEAQHQKFTRSIIESPQEASASLCFGAFQFAGHLITAKECFGINEPGSYVTFLPQLAHPFSRGSIHVQSTDANCHPLIKPNYFSHPLDAEIMARHTMQVETIVKCAPLCDVLKPGGRRLQEGHDSTTLERALEHVRHSSSSNYHIVGTCAMMSKELGGVVDSRLKVYGTKNLRVCDASIFPIQVRGNIQSTVYAVAEKGSDIMKEELKQGRAGWRNRVYMTRPDAT